MCSGQSFTVLTEAGVETAQSVKSRLSRVQLPTTGKHARRIGGRVSSSKRQLYQHAASDCLCLESTFVNCFQIGELLMLDASVYNLQ